MGLFAIDAMAGTGAYPLLVIAAPNEAEAIAVCEMRRKLGDLEYREVFGEGAIIARRPSENERQATTGVAYSSTSVDNGRQRTDPCAQLWLLTKDLTT